MRSHVVSLFLLLAVILGVAAPVSANPLVLDDPARGYSLLEHGRFVPDEESRWTVDDIAGLWKAAARDGVSDVLPERVRSTERFWMVASVQNESEQERWMVSLLVPYLDEVALVVEDANGETTTTRSGQMVGLPKLLPAVGNPQPLTLEPGTPKTLYLLVDARPEPGVDPAELVLRSQPEWTKRAFQLTGFVLLCLGAMLALSLFSVIIWARFREPLYLWFGLFAATTMLLWATAYGVLQLFSGMGWNNLLLNFGANASSLVFCTLFVRRLLREDLPRKLDLAFLGVAAGAGSLMVAMFVTPAWLTYLLNALAALVVWLLLVAATVYASVRGSRDARLLLVAWSVFLISAFLTIVEGLGASLPTLQVRLSTIGSTAVGMLLMALAMGRQMRRLIQQKRVAERSARTDALTDLANRTAFEADYRDYTGSFNEGRYEEVMVAFMDLDGLKGINDARGHETGDNLLRTFARLLEREFRDGDRAYRLGGDEFVVLLPARTAPDQGEHGWLRMRLEGIIAEVRASGFAEADVSFGLASLSETGGNGKETLARADARMYKNKRRKRR